MRKLSNSGQGENLEDLGELECQRSAPNSLLNSVLHENLEDLHVHHSLHDPEEQDCQRPGAQTLLNPVMRESQGFLASKRPSRREPPERTLAPSALPPAVPPSAAQEEPDEEEDEEGQDDLLRDHFCGTLQVLVLHPTHRRLQHRNVDHLHGNEGLDDRLHGAPQNPCLRAATSDRGGGRPPSSSSSKTSKNSVPLPLGVFWPRGGVVLLVLHQLLLQRDRTARGVVELFSQGHCDAHPFVPKHRTEASLPPPPRGACGDAFNIHHDVNR